MSSAQQNNRQLQISTPFGVNEVLLKRISGGEKFSELFHYNLDLIVDISGGPKSLDPKEIIGKTVSVTWIGQGGNERYVHGYVNKFAYCGQDDHQAIYRASIVPWTWFLTNRVDCRIFQNLKVADIIQQVFQEAGFTDFDISFVQGEYPELEYCVQYRESDYDFICRLMSEFGLFFYFRHEASKHTMVIADSKSAYFNLPDDRVSFVSDQSHSRFSQIQSWRHHYELCSGKVAMTDYNFKKPSTDLMSNQASGVGYDMMDKMEVYAYPGRFNTKGDGRAASQLAVEALETGHEIVVASGNYQSITTGGRFMVEEHCDPAEEGREYVVFMFHLEMTSDSYSTGRSGEPPFTCNFQCIPANTIYRTPANRTPRPLVEGPQTAVVVGPAGEEIYVDEHGRIKVQFHWDRVGQKNETSSCWIRVSQNLAGNKWGFMFIPRIGQEVVVEFLEGNPDAPLVTGSVYNGIQKPHYELPAGANKMYIKSNTTKGGDGFNELMFDDTKGAERVFIHAEANYDLRVKNDAKSRVYGNRHEIVGWEKDGEKGGDRNQLVYQDKNANIKRNQIEHIEGNLQLMIGNGDADDGGDCDIVIEKAEKKSVGEDLHLSVEGSRSEKNNGGYALEVGGSMQAKVGDEVRFESGFGKEIHLKAGGKVVLTGTTEVLLKGPGGFISIGQTGVTIQGTMVNINQPGAMAGNGGNCETSEPSTPEEASPKEPALAHDSTTGGKSNF